MGLKDIKIRMQAIKKTASITQAMHNIALSKIRKSTELRTQSKEFITKITDILAYASQRVEDEHRLISEHEVEKKLYILLTSDRGLAGSYHNQLFKAFLEDVKDVSKDGYLIFAIGKKAYYFALKHKLPLINQEIIYNRDDITTMYFRHYAKLIKDTYMSKDIDEVILYYNHYVNTATQVVKKDRLLPVILPKEKPFKEIYIYDTDPIVILDQTTDIYIESSIFSALADAKLSEHAARMIAMKNATDNAHEIVEKLNTLYHRARQQEITSELIDVVNGSNV
ncbi:MAG: ATP synthase F1 subunit gamma [Acholeplasmataceae bacterium]|nr:ATP synthase F1 subunit gamma [Acholeplasmataceae bacterium]